MSYEIRHGDCLAILPTLADNSIDAIVTDPPYHLTINGKSKMQGKTWRAPHALQYKRLTSGFMGKEWDGGDIAFRPDVWLECLRVLKPGGYMVAFGGCRTQHRMVCAIEDAGFVIHPQLIWCFSTGFPKAANASKAIDKHLGKERAVVGLSPNNRERSGDAIAWNQGDAIMLTAPATPEAQRWEGWAYGLGALKPAFEPICLAQKPMVGTGAENILKHGTGAVNIDASRVPGAKPDVTNIPFGAWRDMEGRSDRQSPGQTYHSTAGRWPPNLLLDGSDEVAALFPQSDHARGNKKASKGGGGMYGYGQCTNTFGKGDEGSAARFFPSLGYTDDERLMYCAKAGKLDRAGSRHPTIKPIRLLEWLCRLVCPPGGTILDPFAGSGTTGAACVNLGFRAILIEREDEYVGDIERRMNGVTLGV